MFKRAIVAVCFVAALDCTSAIADSVRDFYSGPGHQVKFIVRSTAGSSYDVLSRLIGRHIGRHIPGQPNIVFINMPGGGGILAANYLARVAPRDGSILSIVGQGLLADQALGLSPSLQADLRQFNWIANIDHSNQILAVWHTSATKTLKDAKERVTLIGASGAGEGSASVQYPMFYNRVLGTKFKVVLGYAGGTEINLAMERGEVEGRGTTTYSDYKQSTPRYISEKLINPIIQIGTQKDSELPNVPLLLDQPVAPLDKPMVEFFSKASTAGRPLTTTPGVPAERVAALRKAFFETVQDPEFIAEAKRLRIEISPTPGQETQSLITDLLDTPVDVRQRTAKVIKP